MTGRLMFFSLVIACSVTAHASFFRGYDDETQRVGCGDANRLTRTQSAAAEFYQRGATNSYGVSTTDCYRGCGIQVQAVRFEDEVVLRQWANQNFPEGYTASNGETFPVCVGLTAQAQKQFDDEEAKKAAIEERKEKIREQKEQAAERAAARREAIVAKKKAAAAKVAQAKRAAEAKKHPAKKGVGKKGRNCTWGVRADGTCMTLYINIDWSGGGGGGGGGYTPLRATIPADYANHR